MFFDDDVISENGSYRFITSLHMAQPAITSSKSTIESTGKWCEICSKLRTMTPERHQWIRFAVFTVNFEHISHVFKCFLGWLWASICLLGNSFFTRIILTKFETVAIYLHYSICEILVLPTLGEGKQERKIRNISLLFLTLQKLTYLLYIISPTTPTEISHSLAIFSELVKVVKTKLIFRFFSALLAYVDLILPKSIDNDLIPLHVCIVLL